MVRSYLKYGQSSAFGLIASANCNAIWCADENVTKPSLRPSKAGRAIVGAEEDVLCWDLKTGDLLSRWSDPSNKAAVTCVSRSQADPDVFAAGYQDGTIRVWDSRTSTLVVTFNGHKSAVTSLAFDRDGVRLASGSKDTNIIIWDLISEAGLFRLHGHKDQITGLQILEPLPDHDVGDSSRVGQLNGGNQSINGNHHPGSLISTSKDALLKIWDIGTQHCLETHVAQSSGECWSMCLAEDQSGLITGGNDGELKVWGLDVRRLQAAASQVNESTTKNHLEVRGSFYRNGKDRTTGVYFHPKGGYVAAHGSDKSIEIWRIRSEGEVRKTLSRKRKRRREKLATANGVESDAMKDNQHDPPEDIASADISDIFVPYVILRTTGKVRSLSWANPESSKNLDILLAESNNSLEFWRVPQQPKDEKLQQPPDYTRPFAVEVPGHRTDVRALSLSSDDRMLASASNGTLKVWNLRTRSCIRTLECGYALCSAFLPGDKIVIVGNRNGELEIFDISSSTLIETVKAHDGPVWTMHVHPDGKSMATGSADKSVKFFDFRVVQEEIPGTKRTSPQFRLVHSRTLKVADDILSLRFSPDARLIALALLDNTVKVFFVDSLKLYLNLYGHKLPVLNMDISFDSQMIVTCSADKNVRLWGLDFGDCHKAFFAHQDSIMQVCFIPNNSEGNGHYFFSASKDQMIKYWDGDKFEQIQKLEGHHGEIWAMAVGHAGNLLVSASHDKSIRVWNESDEQIFLEEEREKELERLYEDTLLTSLEREDDMGEEKAEVGLTGKQTSETLMGGEKIMEALELGMDDLSIMEEFHRAKLSKPELAPPTRNPLYLAHNNISAEAHVLSVVQKIKTAALYDALLVLQFGQIAPLFTFLRIWAERQWNIPLTCRILFFMLKTHHRQITASKQMRVLLDQLREGLRRTLKTQKDQIGFNLAALRFVGKRIEDVGRSYFIDEDLEAVDISKGKKKRGFVDVA